MYTSPQMPEINLDQIAALLTPAQFEIVKGIVATQGKNKGRLRAAKPKVEMLETGTDQYGRTTYEPNEQQGMTAYVWRMVAFSASPMSQHHCMPVTADFDLPGRWGSEKRALMAKLDEIADIVLKTIPPQKHYGTIRWGRALGQI